MFTCRVAVVIEFHAPTRATRDLDNYLKGLFDGLTRSNFWQDDSLVDDLRMVRREVVKGGKLVVTVTEIVKEIGGLFAGTKQ